MYVGDRDKNTVVKLEKKNPRLGHPGYVDGAAVLSSVATATGDNFS